MGSSDKESGGMVGNSGGRQRWSVGKNVWIAIDEQREATVGGNRRQLMWVYQLLPIILHLQHQFAFSLSNLSSSPHNHLCPYEQKFALLQFKQSFSVNISVSADCDSNGKSSYAKTMSWDKSADCCTWDGVTCDEVQGNVIASFRVPSLPTPAFYNFLTSRNSTLLIIISLSRISHRFGGFSCLTHLNLSDAVLEGEIPREISHLSKLISLDLSGNYGGISLGSRTFSLLLENLTQISEFRLSQVNIFAVLPMNLSSSLRISVFPSLGCMENYPMAFSTSPNCKNLY
ncbi:hypothetical protein RJ639_046255 [Escallonia herrerae]|uniref:Leucine-rich repeat-containing N-terminal plant-type domain-containing protein n=1 Tax=Escallonia herrerae TaxID=1293975 RepID=A0AA88W662_9ASTE|nr:hypothetical protein RJ639_046255 [Escallonia herrerae]